MDVADAVKKREELEAKILRLIYEFESETQVTISSLDLGRVDVTPAGGPREVPITGFRIRIEL